MDVPARPEKPIPEPSTDAEAEDRSTRNLLRVLFAVLAAGAVGLLALLFWLLRPEEAAPLPPQGVAGYPIQVVGVITGYGDQPDERLQTPLGVAFDDAGNVWISDTGHGRVLVFTIDGELVTKVGDQEGPGDLFAPYGIAIDPDRDRVYVADWGGRLVQAYSTSGAYIEHLPADDQRLRVFGQDGFSPYDVKVAGGRVIASSNDGLYRFDSTGHVVDRWIGEARGVKLGMFNFPDAFDFDPETGQLYVADTMNRRIVAMDETGKWLWVSGKPDAWGRIRGFWQLPRGLTIGPDGNLYVIDTFRFDREGVGTGHIVVLSPTGELVSEFGRAGLAADSFNFPEHIAVREDGLFALADRESQRVVLFRLGPLPDADPLELEKYEESLRRPEDTWSTPRP